MTGPHPGTAGAGQLVVGMARTLYERGWMPGTAGNVSVRLGDEVRITGSGGCKGELTDGHVVAVDRFTFRPGGVSTAGVRPSAETAIHTAVYRTTDSGAVVHAHPPYATGAASRHGRPGCGVVLVLRGFELLKGLDPAHLPEVRIPVFPNWDDVARIGSDVEATLGTRPELAPALLIAGHGATAWGRDLGQARDRLECVEFLCRQLELVGDQPKDRQVTRWWVETLPGPGDRN